MCFGAAWWANVSRIVFAVTLEESAKLLFPEIAVTSNYLNEKGGKKVEISGGVLREEVLLLYARK